MIKAGILGVSGYTGQELITWLLKHPKINISRLFSTSIEGSIFQLSSSFIHCEDLPDIEIYSVKKCNELDLIFLAVPHTKIINSINTYKKLLYRNSIIFDIKNSLSNLKIKNIKIIKL